MIFYIKKRFKVNGTMVSRRDKYVNLEYEDAKPWIRRGALIRSKGDDLKQFEKDGIEVLDLIKPKSKTKTKAKAKVKNVKKNKKVSKSSVNN